MEQFITYLQRLTLSKDRNIKGHAHGLLKRLQDITEELEK